MTKKVVIVGAGPSGALLAHYLLRREAYCVDVYDRLSDPRVVEFSNARTFPISLTERGMSALGQIPGLEATVRAISLEMSGTIFHQHNGKTRQTTRKKPLVTLDRTNLVITLLETLTQQYDSHRLNLHFNHRCTGLNFEAKTVSFQNTDAAPEAADAHSTVNYDLLIGADGARSIVRSHFLNTELFDFEQKYVPTDYKSLLLPSSALAAAPLESGKIHSWRSNDGAFVVLLHQLDGSMSGVILFPRQKNSIAELSTPEAVLQFFRDRFPEVGQRMPESEAEAFLQRSASRILTIRCSRYHHGDSVLLLGDAAHSVSPSIGQGCNAALEDAAIVNSLLDEYGDRWSEAIAQFTARRKADAHALVELGDHSFPSAPRLFIEFVLREQLAKTLHHLFPSRFSPSLSELVFESNVAYSEILRTYQGWIEKVKKSNQQFLPSRSIVK